MVEILIAVIVVLLVIILGLLKKILDLLIGKICQHDWETKKTISVFDTAKDYSHTIAQCKCKKCGAWKKFKI